VTGEPEILARDLYYIDVGFQGRSGVIAAAVVHGPAGVALIDPGPASTLPALRAGLGRRGAAVEDVRAILLTHIHLDHAGATGELVRLRPDVDVYVHERGAPHMVDPSKLLASAARLYGDAMDRLWGPVTPVPAANVHVLAGGETVEVVGHALRTAYTPGHAVHHVAYHHADSGIAFVGDVGGIRLTASTYVSAPTPPPDIDLERWRESMDRVLAWAPRSLFLTHFGLGGEPAHHFQELSERLDTTSALVRASLDRPGDDAERAEAFAAEIALELRRRMPDAEAARYEAGAPAPLNWQGLARYWRKKRAAAESRAAGE
jgi:glyoxylase-like metal-dependent hydrolase (beta-lactamase superfamily II)